MARKYVFTDKKESRKGIFSAVLGTLALIATYLSVAGTYHNQGVAAMRFSVGLLLAFVYAAVGMVLGCMAESQRDSFHVWAWIGIGLNALALLCMAVIVYIGMYGFGF